MIRTGMLGVLLLVVGCAETDPFQRTGMWQPTGANTLNLAAMVATPRDLIRGRGVVGTPGIEAAPAVARYWANRPTALPSTTSQATSQGQGRAGSGGGAAAGGGEAN